jgi:DNA repair exonuclease SbcCD ATPase subunit
MMVIRLYIKNFMCFDRAYIDLTQFSAALIVGKKDNNDHYSNGVGKTSIFKAIEYVLFNEADVNLEDIILDDALYCHIVIDFMIGDQEYRLSRKRTKKGSTDLTLLERNGQDGIETDVYHSISLGSGGDDNYEPYLDKKDFNLYWKDLSGSRASDTEKDLAKLVKFTYKSFRSTVHFMQNDMTGLATVTPEKRKGILKDALSLLVYAKLEKIAKERAGKITKDIEKNHLLLEQLGDPDQELIALTASLTETERLLLEKSHELTFFNETLLQYNQKVNELTQAHSTLENKFVALLAREQTLIADRSRSETSVKEYVTKCSNLVKFSKNLIAEVTVLKENQSRLAILDYVQIDILNVSEERRYY